MCQQEPHPLPVLAPASCWTRPRPQSMVSLYTGGGHDSGRQGMLLGLLLLLGSCSLGVGDSSREDCPELATMYGCTCTNEDAWCESMGLTVLPKAEYFPSNLKKLYLKENKLTTVDFSNNKFNKLEILDLSSNELSSDSGIGKAVKTDLNSLRELNMAGNQLKLIDSSYLTNTKIRILNLTSNPVEKFVFDDNDETAITHLYMNDLKYKEFPMSSLKVFPELETLDLSGNQISVIGNDAFGNNKKLKTLHLEKNNLSTLPEHIFDGLDDLEQVYLEENPLKCDCHLKWLHEALQKDNSFYQNKAKLRCTDHPTTVLQDVAKEKFTSSPCHKLAERSVPDTLQFDPKKASTDKQIISGSNGPATCVQENQKSLFLIYSLIFDVDSDATCQQECFNNGTAYFNMDGSKCLCGDISENCTCTDCSSLYDMNYPGAKSTISGLKVTYTSPVVIGTPISFSLEWVISADHFELDFGDGSHVQVSPSSTFVHTFQYPGLFHVTISLCSSSTNCRETELDLTVSSLSDDGTIECPSSPYVNTTDKLVLAATFTEAFNEEIVWSRTKEAGTSSRVPCQGGEKMTSEGHCFHVKTTAKMWSLAQEECAGSYDGYLVEVDQQELTVFLKDKLTAQGISKAWIGLKKSDHLDVYTWTSGSLLGGYTALHESVSHGDCVYLADSGEWATESCSTENSFICEYTPNSIVKTTMQLAGSREIGDTNVVPLLATPDNSAKSSYTLLFMPGLWFVEDGVLQWVTYRQNSLQQDTQVKFVVYRPECSSGKKLYEPGCGQNQFFSCSDSMTCIPRPSCPADQQNCFLYSQCISRSEACSCAELSLNEIDCGTDPIVTGLEPSYRPVGNISVTVMRSSENLMKVKSDAGDISVKKGDFLGILYEGSKVPIACSVNTASKWRQLVYSKSGLTDANQAISVSASKLLENYLCEFNVLYSKPQTMSLPSELATFSSAGQYTFQYKVLSRDSTQQCHIHAMEPVGDIVWVEPNLNVDTIKVELTTVVTLVAKVTSGSDLEYEWTIGGMKVTDNMDLSEKCPPGVDNTLPECGTNDTTLDKPFTSISHSFNSQTTLTLRVSNKVSAKEKTVKVMLGPCMPIQGLTLCHESCNTSNGCADPCEPLVKSGESTSFMVTYTQGGVSGKYTYFVNNTEKLTSQDSTYTTTFNEAGLHMVKVNMTCDSHSDTAEVDVNVKHPANIADLQIHLPDGAVIETEFELSITADVDDNAEVDIFVDFGDDKTEKKDSLVTSGGKLKWSVAYMYESEKYYTITVSVNDPFTKESKVKQMYALAAVHIDKIHVTPAFSLPNQEIIFKVATRPLKGTSVILSGTKLHYFWKFDSDNLNIESTVLDHTQNHSFMTPGAYNVSLTVKNVASSYSVSVMVHVEECISGLDLQYNGPVHVKDEVNFTATITAGTNVTFSLDANDGNDRINQSSPFFLFNYDHPGIYNTSLVATNDLTSCEEQSAKVTSYVIDDETLFLLDILPDMCFMTGESGILAAKAINVDPPALDYEWDFGNKTTLSAKGLLNVTILYATPGNYKISVSHIDKSEKFSKTLCVQDEIKGLTMDAPTPISIISSIPINEVVKTSVSQGSDIKYKWKFNGVVQDCDSSHCDFNLLFDGTYHIAVNASNNVSFNTAEKTVEAYYVIETLTVICNSCKNEKYLATTKDAEIAVSTENATSVSYHYDFGSGYTSVNTSSYNVIGVHKVCVNASNRVSSNKTCIEIITQDAVKDFTVTSNTSVEGDIIEIEMGTAVEFTVNYTAGTSVTIIWDCGDGNVVRNTEIHHICIFPESKLYSFSVRAKNEVSRRTMTRKVYVIREIESLSITHTLFNGRYVGTGEAQNMTATSNTDLRVTYIWQVFKATDNNTAICNVTGVKLEQNCKTFSIAGVYFVKLFANNSINSRSAEVAVEAVERIKDLTIETKSSVFEVNATEMLTAKTSTSKETALSFKWQVTRGTVPEILSSTSQMVSYFFNAVGDYKIQVNTTSSLEPEGIHAEKKITIEEPIFGVTITSAKPFNYLKKSSSVTFNIRKSSGSHMKFTWSLSGPGTSVTGDGEELTHAFNFIGEYMLIVEVGNQVSNDSDVSTIYVEEVITAVDLFTNSSLINTETMVTFRAVVTPAGNFKYNWTVNSNQLTVTEDTFYQLFPGFGIKVVQVYVHNNVSGISEAKTILVQEPISGLTIDNCDSKVTGEEAQLHAVQSKGSDITYTWTIIKPNGNKDSGEEVTMAYSFDSVGFYTVVLSAVNNVSEESVNCTLKAQGRVKITDIFVSSDRFVNQTIYFEAIGMNFEDATISWSVNGTEVHSSSDKEYSDKFAEAGLYEVKVNVTNEVSNSQFTKTFQVHVLDCKLPLVKVVSKTPAMSKRSRYFVLAVSIDTSNCKEYQSKHSWKIYRAVSCKEPLTDPVSLGSSYTESLTLHLKARTLPTGSYCAVFNTSYVDTFVYETAYINLTVTASKLRAIIDGGNERKLSRGSKVVMSCLNSWDPDDRDSQLLCQWTCQSKDPSSSCPWSSQSERRFGNVFTQAGTYTVKLSVTDPNSARTATAQQLIVVTLEAVPSINITCVSCQSTGENKISTGLQLALGTTCSNCGTQTVVYTWSVVVDGTVLTLDKQHLLTGLSVSNLVIKEGVIPAGSKYVITASANFKSSSSVGTGTLELEGNSGPSGGTCTVDRREVLNLEEPVEITCSGWIDDNDDQLFYQVLVKETSDSETVSYPAYHGTDSQTEIYLASLADPADSTVKLEAKVCDVYGACTESDLGSVKVKPPSLDASKTKTEYIFEQSQSKLPVLLKQNNPSRLLPYVIALIQELNHEYSSNSSLTSKEKRATIRDASTISLMAIPVSTLEDVQQVAFLLQLLTKYFDEYQTEACHLVIVESLKNITDVLQGYAVQGRNQEHFVPHHLLATISNLIDSVNLGVYNPEAVSHWKEYPIESYYNSFKNLRPEINSAIEKVKQPHDPTLTGKDIAHRQTVVPSAFEIAEQIVTMMLMTTMWLEKSIVIKLGGIEVHGHRSKVKEIWERRELNGSVFFLPDNLFQGNPSEDEEIFQIMLVHRKNPFTWDYVKNLTVNSRVPSLSFKFNNGMTIPVKNLPESKRIKMYIFENVENNETQILNGKDLIKSEYHKPLEKLQYTTKTVKSNKAKLVSLDTAVGADSSTGVHIQVRIAVLANTTEEETGLVPNGYVDVYLGTNFQARRGRYTAHKRITSEQMAEGADHRDYTFYVTSERFSSKMKYYLSVYNDDGSHDVNVSVSVYFSTCQFFNMDSKQWDATGCSAVDESITTVTVCSCGHLTSFGGSMLAPPSVIDITDLENLDLATNPVVMIAISVILFTYLVLVVAFRKLDRLDLKRISMIPLCGQDGSHKFEVTVVTGRQLGAGTSAHIGIKLYGHDEKGSARHLTKEGAFQRNCSDTFIIAHEKSLGHLYKILIWHDNAGLSPSWYLSHIIVKDLYNHKKYFFIGNAWLSVEMEAGILKKELHVATEKELSKFTTSFKMATSHGFADKHLWLSLMDRPDHSRFTRVQRATCGVTVILFFMMVNAMWYGVLKTDSNVTRSMADYSFSWEEIVIGLVSNIVIFPVALILIALFKKSRSKENTFQQVQKPQSAQTIEIPCDFGSGYRLGPHGDWGSYYERESTTGSIPMTARLKRTQTLAHVNHTFSQDGSIMDGSECSKTLPQAKSSVASLMRTQHLMQGDLWSKENILKNWPEKVPTCPEDERKSTTGTIRGGKSSATSKGKGKGKKSEYVDSDEEFQQTLDQLEKNLNQDNKKRKGSKVSDKKSGKDADGLFSSDDDWVEEGLEEVKTNREKTRKTINRTPARAAGATAQTRFNPREDPKLRGRNRTSFSLDDQLSSEDELNRSKVKVNKKKVHMNGNPTGKEDSKKDAPQRKISSSSILKKRDSSRAFSASSSMKETSFMNQPSFISPSEKSKSNMSSIWMSNYYSSNHRMREETAGCMLPSWCVYAAYALCAAISATSIIIVLLYGYNFGAEVSLKWLLSLLISFFCSALILEPSKVLFIAMYLAARKKDVNEEIENENIDILPSVQSNETFKDVKSRPLGGFALLQAREEGHKIQRMHVMIRQFVSHMFLLTLLLAISFVHYTPHSYITSQHLHQQLHTDGSAALNLSMVRSLPDFQRWTETVLADTLHRHELLPLEQFGVLLGPARLRQLRNMPDECIIKSSLNKLWAPGLGVLPCDGGVSFYEDKSSYDVGWSNTGANLSWRYHSPEELDMRSQFGHEVWYSGGGYVAPLGSTHNQTLDILADLFSSDWFNLRTRAVFIEFTLYTPGLDLTSVVSILVEFPVTGGVLSSSSISTQKLLRHLSGTVDPLMVCEVLFFLCVIYLVAHLALVIRDQRRKFVRSFWNWLDMVIIVIVLACISLYVVCVVTATDTFSYYAAHKNGFTNFEKTSHLHDITRQMHAWLLFLFFLKIAHQLRFIKYFHVYGKTISALLGKLAGCTLIFILLLITYAQLGYLYFGMVSRGFASFQTSLLTLFGVIRGTFDFWEYLTHWPVMTHFYFYSFYAFTYGLFIALVLAVMNDTYKMTRQSMYYKATLDTQDYEMIEFIMKRFKLWTGIMKQKPAFRRVKFKGLPSLPSRGSTSMSSISRRSSITSTSSNGEPLLTEEAALHLEHQLDNAVPQWENVLSRFNKIEKLEKEEDQQMKKIEKEFKNWETKKASPKRKPPSTAFQKFQQNFRGKSQMVNKQKGLIGRTSATPPTDSPRKQEVKDDKRPLSDQGERADGKQNVNKTNDNQKKRDSTKNVHFSKQAW